ncbi:Xyloglucan galactosyltransferase XLT2-like protein [Drosera capensis]
MIECNVDRINCRFGPYFCQPVIAGLGDDDKPFICTMDSIGAKELAKDFVVAGTSSESLYGACEAMFKPDMEPEELFETVSQALLASVDRDCLAGWGGHVYVVEVFTYSILVGQEGIGYRRIRKRWGGVLMMAFGKTHTPLRNLLLHHHRHTPPVSPPQCFPSPHHLTTTTTPSKNNPNNSPAPTTTTTTLRCRRSHASSSPSSSSNLSSSSSLTTSPSPSPSPTTTAADDRCPFGSIFVYDLPSAFNLDIANDCHNLNPWNSRCHSLSNHGFGPSANAALSRVLPAELSRLWYWTDQFSSELIFHRRILRHRCRTSNPGSATAFYIPFYAGLAVGRYLWADHQGSVADRDRDCDELLQWIRGHGDQFNRSRGWDHFITMGRITWDFRRSKENEWGSHCIYSHGMENVTRLLIERNPWDYFDVAVPYPTGFHPERDADVIRWQALVRSRQRKTLFCFAGASRGVIKNDFRGTLLSQCRDALGACRVVDCAGNRCANGTSEVLETFLDSRFCLQPRGDSFTRRSIFDCMVAGAIPVFFWRRTAYLQYEWFLPGEPESYSVFIHRDKVKNGTSIKEVLEGYGDDNVNVMREKVIEYIPRLVYAKPDQGLESIRDAFDIAIDGVLQRMRTHKEMRYKFD